MLLSFTGPNKTSDKKVYSQTGIASYYASFFDGRLTANGELFSNQELTCAHKTLPFGTLLKVTRMDINKSIIVRVNDRGPFVKGREVDLSQRAANELEMFDVGVCKVQIEIVTKKMVVGVLVSEQRINDTLEFDHLELQPISLL